MCRQKIEIIEKYLNEKEKDKEVEIDIKRNCVPLTVWKEKRLENKSEAQRTGFCGNVNLFSFLLFWVPTY